MTEYDSIVEEYASSRDTGLERYVNYPTFVAALGDIKGQRALDLACGSGHSTRLLASLGARKYVKGLDISRKQIELARAIEAKEERGIFYCDLDCFDTSFSLLGRFDLVTGAYFLHYADREEKIRKALVRSRFALEDDGRFVGLIGNPDLGFHYNQYGVKVDTKEDREGSSQSVQLFDLEGNPVCSPFTNYYWFRKTYEELFREAGFKFRWMPTVISDEGMKKYGKAFWQKQLKQPNVLCFELRR